jgi:hypothetical protein
MQSPCSLPTYADLRRINQEFALAKSAADPESRRPTDHDHRPVAQLNLFHPLYSLRGRYGSPVNPLPLIS